MEKPGIDSILAQLQAASTQASGKKPAATENEVPSVDFSQKLKAAVDQVNDAQQSAGKLSKKFASGDTNTDLHEVMVSLQKANVSFQSMVQVRNKLVTAYQEIMNMQV